MNLLDFISGCVTLCRQSNEKKQFFVFICVVRYSGNNGNLKFTINEVFVWVALFEHVLSCMEKDRKF